MGRARTKQITVGEQRHKVCWRCGGGGGAGQFRSFGSCRKQHLCRLPLKEAVVVRVKHEVVPVPCVVGMLIPSLV